MEKLQLRDFTNYKFISKILHSNDYKHATFITSQCDLKNNKYASNIWLYDTKSKEVRKLTSSDDVKSCIWINNEEILFQSIRSGIYREKLKLGDEFSVFYKININGGEAEEYFYIPLSASSVEKIDSNRYVVLSQHKNIDNTYDSNNSDEICCEILDEIPFWTNGGGFINKKRNRLYLFNKETNSIKPITDELTNVIQFKVKNDKVLYTAHKYKDKKEPTSGLYVYDIICDKTLTLVDEYLFDIKFSDFYKDTYIFAGLDLSEFGQNGNSDIYIIENNTYKKLYRMEYNIYNNVTSDCRYGDNEPVCIFNDEIYFISTEHTDSVIKKISKSNELETVVDINGAIDGFNISKSEILYIAMTENKLQEIYSYKNNSKKQITFFNKNIYESKKLSTPEKLVIKNDDIEIEGFVLCPVDFDKNKKYPAILDIHGGPKTVYGNIFYHEMQMLSNEGYFVFFCNPRGSDGRGRAFGDIRGKYGTIDYDDIMKFTDKVLESYPQIDKERLGVTGGSYGGFMTNWIIGHTDRFKCAVSQRCISNWVSKFLTTDIGYYYNADQQASTPWINHEKIWWHSPVKYADKVKTPTLFIHSTEDYRCWISEGLQMFTALKYHGINARMCIFKGENHDLSRSGKPKHRIRRLEEILNWFNTYLK